jgi:hypothetical protein
MTRTILLVGLAALIMTTTTTAGETRHSGRVAAVAPDRGGFTLEEVGPWTGPGTGLVTREVRLAPGTAVQLVTRASDLAATWPVAFETSRLAATDLRPGDYVTVTLDDAGEARAVEVTPVD